MVALSTDDTNKQLLPIEDRSEGKSAIGSHPSGYQLLGPIRQRRRRLTEAPVIEIAAHYEGVATRYELAFEFGCHRATIGARLKMA